MAHEEHQKPVKAADGKVTYDNPELPLDESFLKANPWNGAPRGVGVSGELIPVMPSSEAHFFDFSQSHEEIQKLANGPSGINFLFPYPSSLTPAIAETAFSTEWWAVSGSLKTFGPDSGLLIKPNPDESGIFHFNGPSGLFSLTGIKPPKIDFKIFQPYIHHGVPPEEDRLEIPFVSDYTISSPYYPYPY